MIIFLDALFLRLVDFARLSGLRRLVGHFGSWEEVMWCELEMFGEETWW